MSLWLMVLLAGIVIAVIALISNRSAEGLYTNGIIESCFPRDTEGDCLQVRAYVAETLVHDLPSPPRVIGRMFIRETNTSVPLRFERVPTNVSPRVELSEERRQRRAPAVVPVIFSFDPVSNVAVHPGQLVDVYIGGR